MTDDTNPMPPPHVDILMNQGESGYLCRIEVDGKELARFISTESPGAAQSGAAAKLPAEIRALIK